MLEAGPTLLCPMPEQKESTWEACEYLGAPLWTLVYREHSLVHNCAFTFRLFSRSDNFLVLFPRPALTVFTAHFRWRWSARLAGSTLALRTQTSVEDMCGNCIINVNVRYGRGHVSQVTWNNPFQKEEVRSMWSCLILMGLLCGRAAFLHGLKELQALPLFMCERGFKPISLIYYYQSIYLMLINSPIHVDLNGFCQRQYNHFFLEVFPICRHGYTIVFKCLFAHFATFAFATLNILFFVFVPFPPCFYHRKNPLMSFLRAWLVHNLVFIISAQRMDYAFLTYKVTFTLKTT